MNKLRQKLNHIPLARKNCDSCLMLSINGIVCHELGCPDAWRDEKRSCYNCGCEFTPAVRHQKCCDQECENSYYS